MTVFLQFEVALSGKIRLDQPDFIEAGFFSVTESGYFWSSELSCACCEMPKGHDRAKEDLGYGGGSHTVHLRSSSMRAPMVPASQPARRRMPRARHPSKAEAMDA